MTIDLLIDRIQQKKNPCIAGIDPEWRKLPDFYRRGALSPAAAILDWASDVIDSIADIIPAVKPQMAFFEIYGAEGLDAFRKISELAHLHGLLLIDDSKRNDIGNTARAYAYAHLSPEGPINADFMTVSPFLGPDSLQPFVDAAGQFGKGLFILVKTSNPSSVEISEAIHHSGEKISRWLAGTIDDVGRPLRGSHGYSSVGAVVGATFPEEAAQLRKRMPHSFFLVPGFGAQGGGADDVLSCFNSDGLGAVVSSSRGILYPHLSTPEFGGSQTAYLDLVRAQALKMKRDVYSSIQTACPELSY